MDVEGYEPTSATTVPVELWLHVQVLYTNNENRARLVKYTRRVTGMLLTALSCLLRPWLSMMSVKLFTPEPPVHVQLVVHFRTLPHSETSAALSDPEVALPDPYKQINPASFLLENTDEYVPIGRGAGSTVRR